MRVYFASYQGKHPNISTTTHAKNKMNMRRDEKGSLDVSVGAFVLIKMWIITLINMVGCSGTQGVGFKGNMESKSQDKAMVDWLDLAVRLISDSCNHVFWHLFLKLFQIVLTCYDFLLLRQPYISTGTECLLWWYSQKRHILLDCPWCCALHKESNDIQWQPGSHLWEGKDIQ